MKQPTRKRSSKKVQSLLALYGLCEICEAPVSIPGLCGYKCSVCGWVKMAEIAMLIKKRAAKSKPTQNNSSLAVPENLGVNSLPNLAQPAIANSS